MLVISEHLADKRIDVHDETIIARAGTRQPRAPQTLCQHSIELANMPERERPQERAQRRGCRDAMTEHRAGLSRAQHVAVLDAVRTEHHCRDQAHYFAPRVRRPRPVAEIDRLIDQRRQPQPASQQRGQHHASIRDDPLIIENDARCVRQTLHHAGDPLVQDPQPLARPVLPAQGVI